MDWKGKDGKMGQEISWCEKPNISTLRKSPRIGTCVRVRGTLYTLTLTLPVPACTRVKDYGRVPCPKSLAAAGRK